MEEAPGLEFRGSEAAELPEIRNHMRLVRIAGFGRRERPIRFSRPSRMLQHSLKARKAAIEFRRGSHGFTKYAGQVLP